MYYSIDGSFAGEKKRSYGKSRFLINPEISVVFIEMLMQTVQIQLPETVFSALRKTPGEFVQEMRIAAAVKWYELGEVSQGKAAEIAGLSRSDFIAALSRYKVSVLQYMAEDLAQELGNAD